MSARAKLALFFRRWFARYNTNVTQWLCAHDAHDRPHNFSSTTPFPSDGSRWVTRWVGDCPHCGTSVDLETLRAFVALPTTREER
jgi:hypothetical protein